MPVGSGVTVRGGPGALADALGGIARKAGATIRIDVARRRGSLTRERPRDGRRARERRRDSGPRRRLGRRSRDRRSPSWSIRCDLPPTFVERMRHYRARGVTAKINLALDRRAGVHGARRRRGAARAAACSSRRTSTTSSARSTRRSTARCRPSPGSRSRFRAMTDRSLAPDGRARDVDLRALRAAPSARRGTGATTRGAVSAVMRVARAARPGPSVDRRDARS